MRRTPLSTPLLLTALGLLFSPAPASALLVNASDCVGQVNASGACVLTTSSSGTTNQLFAGTDLQPGGVEDVEIDTQNHRLFVSDTHNNRILVFNLDSNNQLVDRTADFVLGQPNFTTSAAPNPPTRASLNDVSGLLLDGNNLYVADWRNNRVLVFDVSSITSGEDAVMVLGQSDFVSNGSGCLLNQLNRPEDVAKVGNQLFVPEFGNDRVLVFTVSTLMTGATASGYLGSATCTAGNSQSTFDDPTGVAGSGNRLFVADSANNRVMVFDVATVTNGENAINLLGQSDYGISTARTTQNGMRYPHRLSVAGNFLYLAEGSNHRVSIWDVSSITNGMNATAVLGQSDFVSGASNRGQAGPTADGLNGPLDVKATSNRIIVADAGNNRVTILSPVVSTTVSNQSATKGQCRSGVPLAATGTSSLVGGTIAYNWTQSSGATGTLTNGTTATATFTCSTTGDRVLTPSPSAMGLTNSAQSLTLSVSNTAPTITSATASDSPDAGSTFNAGEACSLSCVGSDPDSDTLTYSWTQTAGVARSLSSTTASSPTFTCGPRQDYTFQCAVSDGEATAVTSNASFTVTNTPPVVTYTAPASQTPCMCCETCTLPGDRIAITDADSGVDTTFTHQWSFVTVASTPCVCPAALVAEGIILPAPKAQTTPTITGATSLTRATFRPTASGDYTVRLTTTDQGGATANTDLTYSVQALDTTATGPGDSTGGTSTGGSDTGSTGAGTTATGSGGSTGGTSTGGSDTGSTGGDGGEGTTGEGGTSTTGGNGTTGNGNESGKKSSGGCSLVSLTSHPPAAGTRPDAL